MSLPAAFDDLIALIEGLTPPASALPTGFYSAPYKHAPGRIDPEGAETEDRLFWFDGFVRQPQLETTVASTRVEYAVPLAMLLRNSELNLLDQMKRATLEAQTITRAIEAQQSWSDGVQAVITGPSEVAPTENNETDVVLVTQLAVTVIEE